MLYKTYLEHILTQGCIGKEWESAANSHEKKNINFNLTFSAWDYHL